MFKILTIDGGQCLIFKKQKETFIPDLYDQFKDLPFQYLCENFNSLPIIDFEEGLKLIKSELKNI